MECVVITMLPCKTIECGGKCSQYIDKQKKKIPQLLEYDSISVKHMFYAEKHISVVKIYVTFTSLCFCEISKCFPCYMVYSEIKHVLKSYGSLICFESLESHNLDCHHQ